MHFDCATVSLLICDVAKLKHRPLIYVPITTKAILKHNEIKSKYDHSNIDRNLFVCDTLF